MNKIIDDKEGEIEERFENKLFNIFFDKNRTIPKNDLMELKKLGSALLITKKIIPISAAKNFLKQNVLNNNEISGIVKMNIDLKKGYIFSEMEDILLIFITKINKLRKLDNIFEDKYIKEFKEKYGILDEEISDNIIKQEIIKQNYNEKHILEAILKKLNYIK